MLKNYIKYNLKSEFIRRSKLLINSFILFIKKKDKGLRLYVDYRILNAITIRDRYSILLISKILNYLRYIKIYIKIDLRKVYNLI